MTDIARQAKEAFPTNIIVALIIGLIIGYSLATYVNNGSAGLATGTCGSHTRWCAGDGKCYSDVGPTGTTDGSDWAEASKNGVCKSGGKFKGESA